MLKKGIVQSRHIYDLKVNKFNGREAPQECANGNSMSLDYNQPPREQLHDQNDQNVVKL